MNDRALEAVRLGLSNTKGYSLKVGLKNGIKYIVLSNGKTPEVYSRDCIYVNFQTRQEAISFYEVLRAWLSGAGPGENSAAASPSGQPPQPSSQSGLPPEQRSSLTPRQEAASAEKDLDQAWSNLSPQQKNSIRQDERNWIKMKDGIPADDPRRAEEVRKRADYLQSIQKNQPATSPPTTSTVTALDQAEQSLTQVYRQIWARLSKEQRAALKASEIQWIKMKESIPVTDPRKLQAIQARIEYLRSYGQSQ